jgi:putative phage-type endonuclease
VTAVEAEPMLAEVPDGALVYDGPPLTPEWFEVRRSGITASDLPAIVVGGDGPYAETPLHVWLDKRGELPDRGHNHFAEAGRRAEPMIAQWWADDNGVKVRETGIWAHGTRRWMLASPDRIPDRCPDGDGPCGVEVKNRNAYVAGQWRDDVPDDVLAQTGWQMAVTGWGHVHVAALIGGNTPRWHRVDRDPVLEQYLIGEAARVWAAVLDGVPPQVDPSAALARLLEAIYPERAGGRGIDPVTAADLYRRYREGLALEKQGGDLKAQVRNEVIVLLDDAEELTVPGQAKALATFRAPDASDVITADALRRLKTEHPRIYTRLRREGFITRTTPSRVLRWGKRVGEDIQ